MSFAILMSSGGLSECKSKQEGFYESVDEQPT